MKPEIPVHILGSHQKSILHGMHIDQGGNPAPVAWEDMAQVHGDGGRLINDLPAAKPGSPGQIRVLSVGKEVFIPEFPVQAEILH